MRSESSSKVVSREIEGNDPPVLRAARNTIPIADGGGIGPIGGQGSMRVGCDGVFEGKKCMFVCARIED